MTLNAPPAAGSTAASRRRRAADRARAGDPDEANLEDARLDPAHLDCFPVQLNLRAKSLPALVNRSGCSPCPRSGPGHVRHASHGSVRAALLSYGRALDSLADGERRAAEREEEGDEAERGPGSD